MKDERIGQAKTPNPGRPGFGAGFACAQPGRPGSAQESDPGGPGAPPWGPPTLTTLGTFGGPGMEEVRLSFQGPAGPRLGVSLSSRALRLGGGRWGVSPRRTEACVLVSQAP